jgi:hypothetical protein
MEGEIVDLFPGFKKDRGNDGAQISGDVKVFVPY